MLDGFQKGKYNASGIFTRGKDDSATDGDFFRIMNSSGLNPIDGLRIGGGFELGTRWNHDPYFFDRFGETIHRNIEASDTPIGRGIGVSPHPFVFGTKSYALRT